MAISKRQGPKSHKASKSIQKLDFRNKASAMSSMVMPVVLSLCFALAFLIFSYMQLASTSP